MFDEHQEQSQPRHLKREPEQEWLRGGEETPAGTLYWCTPEMLVCLPALSKHPS